ncbi:MAG: hypothetical protein HFI54_13915 [Lachnospiraceae bacterium]|nr:hypothetical protein [Lachnospiraceae bacterium]
MILEEEYSEEWLQLIKRKEEFEKAALRFNNVDEEKKSQDLSKALKNTDLFGQISVLKMMGEGYLFTDSIELVVEDLVQIAILGYEDCMGWAGVALNHLNMKKWKDKIIQLVFFYTNNNLNNKEIFHYSWLLLYKLRFKYALEKYIDIYEEYMIGEFDDEDLLDIKNMEER